MIDYFGKKRTAAGRSRSSHPLLKIKPLGGTYVPLPVANLAAFTLKAGKGTFGVVVPPGTVPAGKGLKLGGLTTQTDVLRRWADGSAMHLALSCSVPYQGEYDLTVADPPTGTFTPAAPPTVSVTFNNCCRAQMSATGSGYTAPTASFSGAPGAAATVSGGIVGLVFTNPGAAAPWAGPVTFADSTGTGASATAWVNYTYTANMPATFPAADWLNGPVVKEGRTLVVPLAQDATPHPSLRVYFGLRCYSDGSYRVVVVVENTLDVPENVPNTYNVVIAVNGSTVYTGPANVVHYPYQRFVQKFWVPAGGAVQSGVVVYDFSTAIAAGACPAFDARLTSQPYAVGTGRSWDSLPCPAAGPNVWIGDLAYSSGWNDPGAHSWIYEPNAFHSQYLAHPDDQATLAYMIKIAELFGGLDCHMRNPDGTFVVGGNGQGSSDPNHFWADPRAYPFYRYPVANWRFQGPQAGWNGYDNAHGINWAYYPYLITADRHLADELRFNGYYTFSVVWPDNHCIGAYAGLQNYTKGNGYGTFQEGQVRSVGWALRTLAQAAAILPADADVQQFLTNQVNTTLDLIGRYASGTLGSGVISPDFPAWWGLAGDISGPYWGIIQWMENYIALAIEVANQLGFAGGESKKAAQAQFAINLLTGDSRSDHLYYPKNAAALYRTAMGDGDANHNPLTFWTSLSQVGNYYSGANAPPANGTLALADSPYVSDAFLLCRIGRRLGLSGAQAALDVLEAQRDSSNIPSLQKIWVNAGTALGGFGWDLNYWLPPPALPPSPAPHHFTLSGFPSPANSGAAAAFTLSARDSSGNLLTNYRGSVHFTSSDGSAVLPADYTFRPADGGQKSLSATMVTAGTQSITATDLANSASGSQSGITVSSPAPLARSFAGNPDYATTPASVALALAGDISMAAWVNHAPSGDQIRCVFELTTYNTGGVKVSCIMLATYTNLVIGYINNGSFDFAGSVPDNVWTHVGMRWTNSTQTFDLFAGGVKVKTKTVGQAINYGGANPQVSFGRQQGGGDYWAGAMCDLSLWGSALADADFATLAAATKPGKCLSVGTGLVEYWPFQGANPEVGQRLGLNATLFGNLASEGAVAGPFTSF